MSNKILISVLFVLLITHLYQLFPKEAPEITDVESLYLINEASMFIPDIDRFEQKIRVISDSLGIKPEWLMSVIKFESGFQTKRMNLAGSGATGLLQFMPGTITEMNRVFGSEWDMQQVMFMSAVGQLELVFKYLKMVRDRSGDYDSLTDLYLAILYPRARKKDPCYVLFVSPSIAYKQNAGLDMNKDGYVMVNDIQLRMMKEFVWK